MPANDSAAEDDTLGILDLIVPDHIVIRIIDAMHCMDDDISTLPDVQFTDARISETAEFLRGIYAAAFIEHSLSTRDLTTKLDRLLERLVKAKVEDLEQATDPASFDHFIDLFQAAAVDIWIQSARTIDYRGFREDLNEPSPSSLRALQSLARHLQNERSIFLASKPLQFVSDLARELNSVQREVKVAYYKYLRPRSDRYPDRTIVQLIARLYEITFGARFTLSEQKSDQRKTSDRNLWNGPSMRFACAIIRELRLYRLMGPFSKAPTDFRPDLSPLALPKQRSYNEFGDDQIDFTKPFPWELTRSADSPASQNSWELMKTRIKDSWSVETLARSARGDD